MRRLARDLPAFDSVWIDALVQLGRLTSFQAKLLESAEPERIRVGPCVLVSRLGGGLYGETFLARHIESGERCVLKCRRLAPETLPSILERLQALTRTAQHFRHAHVVVPHVCKRLPAEGFKSQTAGRLKTYADAEPDRLVLLSRHVAGFTLKELLIRRGRFSPAVVWEIGRQLLDGLAALEQLGLVHGDIGVSNVRLTRAGQAVLVDAGVRPAVEPELAIHANVSPERYDGTAPERIGTGEPATIVSDLYSLGCLLWTLLAGRPPFPTGDPLAKLAAHQTRPVPEIREWSPDTPTELAELISRLTAMEPADRPPSAAEALKQWRRPTRLGQRRLRRFRAQFDGDAAQVPSPAGKATTGRWSVLVASIFALSGLTLALFDQGARSYLLDLTGRLPGHRFVVETVTKVTSTRRERPLEPEALQTVSAHKVSPRSAETSRSVADSARSFLSIPPPDPQGVILLDSNGPYKAADISTVGPLVVRGADGVRPTIVVDAEPVRVWAQDVLFENVRFVTRTVYEATKKQGRSGPSNGKASLAARRDTTKNGAAGERSRAVPAALLLVRSQTLTVRSCVFQTEPLEVSSLNERRERSCSADPSTKGKRLSQFGRSGRTEAGRTGLKTDASAGPPVAVGWKPVEVASAGMRLVDFQNCVLVGDAAGVYVGGRVEHLAFSNTLKLGAKGLLQIAVPEVNGRTLRLSFSHVTLRRSGPLIKLLWPPRVAQTFLPDSLAFQLKIKASLCVFDVSADSPTALIEWLGPAPATDWGKQIKLLGGGSLIPVSVPLLGTVSLSSGEFQEAGSSKLAVEGLFASEFQFTGSPSLDWSSSQLASWNVPLPASQPPGINAEQLPTFPKQPLKTPGVHKTEPGSRSFPH